MRISLYISYFRSLVTYLSSFCKSNWKQNYFCSNVLILRLFHNCIGNHNALESVFLEHYRKICIPELYIYIYDNKVIGISEPHIQSYWRFAFSNIHMVEFYLIRYAWLDMNLKVMWTLSISEKKDHRNTIQKDIRPWGVVFNLIRYSFPNHNRYALHEI